MQETTQNITQDTVLYEEDKLNPTFFPRHQKSLYNRLETKHSSVDIDESDPLGTQMVLNIGPQHPATHGVLRIVTRLDGERIQKCVVDIGYLHRGIEKLAEWKTFQEFMPYTDRMDYLAPYANNVAFCMAVEKLAQIQVPERAQYIRMIACELARISAHLLFLGTYVMDAGAVSMFMYAFRERENIYSIFDKLAGVRFTVSHSRVGGVQYDLTDEAYKMIQDWVKHFKKELDGWNRFLNRNPILFNRMKGVGQVTQQQAIDYGFTGPNLRASGVAHDLRLSEPYLFYDRMDFKIPVRTEGDALARYMIRMEEMAESAKIIEQCLEQIPEGDIRADNAKQSLPSKDEVYYSMEGMIHDFMIADMGIIPPKGEEAYAAAENPKGELGFHIKSDGTGKPWRMKINAPSFSNLQVLEQMFEGAMVADLVILIGSIDPVMGESDK
jgi:NADH-quinone oxidoreductase subunit D